MFEPYLMGQYQYPWQGMTPAPNWQPQTPQVAQGQLQEFYDWQRTKTMDCMAEVKVLVDSYK